MTFRPLRSPNPCFRREPRPGRSPPAERAQHVGPYSGSSSDWQDAIADAQRELTAADDADEQQWAIATPIVDRAAAEISGLARAGVSRLTRGDLERLTALEADLARVEQELGR